MISKRITENNSDNCRIIKIDITLIMKKQYNNNGINDDNNSENKILKVLILTIMITIRVEIK